MESGRLCARTSILTPTDDYAPSTQANAGELMPSSTRRMRARLSASRRGERRYVGMEQSVSGMGDAIALPSYHSVRMRRSILLIAAVLAAAWGYLLALHGAAHTFVDAQVYVKGMHRLLHGISPYSLTSNPPFDYPPSAIPLLWPLGLLAVKVAGALLDGVAAAFFLTAVRRMRLRGHWPVEEWLVDLAALLALLVCMPGRSDLLLGQVSVVVMALTVIAALDITEGRHRGGWLLGLAIALKLTPALFLVWALARRSWGAVLRACGLFAALTLAGSLPIGTRVISEYDQAAKQFSALVKAQPYGNLSLLGAVKQWHLAVPLTWTLVAILAVCVGAVVLAVSRRDHFGEAGIVVVGIASALFSPVSWDHAFVWLLAALLLMAFRKGAADRDRWVALVLALLLVPNVQKEAFQHLAPGAWRDLGLTSMTLISLIALGLLVAQSRRQVVLRTSGERQPNSPGTASTSSWVVSTATSPSSPSR